MVLWVGEMADRGVGKILVVGDVGKAFSDAGRLGGLPFEVCDTAADAVAVAARGGLGAIAVVMGAASVKLNSALKALRKVNSGVKIVLLAQMYEEPFAIKLVTSTANAAPIADEYLICPIEVSRFCEYVWAEGFKRKVEQAAVAVSPGTETRMRMLEKLATEDDLTGLKNRRYVWEFSRQVIKRAEQENGRVTLLLFDVDDLKSYNDIYGHLSGDKILKQAAVSMRRSCRPHDVVGRIGGDEFAVVFWDGPRRKSSAVAERRSISADHPREAITIARRFRTELSKTELHLLRPNGKETLTISGGLASFPRDGRTIEELFEQADEALLGAKRSGKNRIYLVGKPNSDITTIE